MANNDLGGMTEAAFNKHISRALETGDGKTFEFPKGTPSSPSQTMSASADCLHTRQETCLD
jgi:hypothetical protein